MSAPKQRRPRYPGRRPLDNHAVLTGILFVLQSSIPWETLPCQSIHHHATPSRHHSACRWGL
ncbi:hypothetical protein CJO92_22855 (plasmid) [Ralstonia solanacearum]|uniref:Transposase n=1 Tax=Ralstonia solanacearum TaxID=305 RepID=A0AAD0SD18_RALSL|nr:hypothetical protein CJO77_22840 [Ralstonia solanacearum]AXW55473.1 hypothetical protein CJO92_22855 [Ralstonia solanacearum]